MELFYKLHTPLYYREYDENGIAQYHSAVYPVVESKYPDCMSDPEYYMFNGYHCLGVSKLCDSFDETALMGVLGAETLAGIFDPEAETALENRLDKIYRGFDSIEQLKEYRDKYYDNIEYLVWYCMINDIGSGSAIPAGTGDVNNDYSFNSRDAALLMRHLASWDVSAQNFKEKYADMNQDGAVNSRDVAIMLRIQAGWHNAE